MSHGLGPRRPTMHEIAIQANVSRASVSIILSDPAKAAGRFRPETIERVRRIAAEMGYQVNLMATSLKHPRSPFFGLVLRGVAEIDAVSWHHQAFEGQFQAGVVATARAAHLYPVLAAQDLPADMDVIEHVRVVLDGGAFGAIFRTPVPALEAMAFERVQRGFPMAIVFPEQIASCPSNTIDVDNRVAGRLAADLFTRIGRKRWGILRDETPWPALTLREEGMRAAAAEAGARLDLFLLPNKLSEPEIAQWLAPRLRELRPDGLFAASSSASVGALLACRTAGLRVPEDTCLIGCDASLWQPPGAPSITSVHVSWHTAGEIAVRKLIELREKGVATFENVLLTPEIRRGETCPGGEQDPPQVISLQASGEEPGVNPG